MAEKEDLFTVPADTQLTETIKQQAVSTMPKMTKAELHEQFGDMDADDITIPRIVILQGLSPEVSEGRGKPGEFFIKGLERNLGAKPIEIVVLLRNKSRIRWQDLQLGGGLLCRSFDAKEGQGDPGGKCETCKFSAWEISEANKSGRPGCDLYQNLIVVLRQDDDWMPMAVSGNRTKLKALKNLNSLLMVELSKYRPLFAKSYIMESQEKTNSKGMRYFSYRVSPGNGNAMIPEAEQFRAYDLYKSLQGKKIEIVQEQEKDEPVGSPSGEF